MVKTLDVLKTSDVFEYGLARQEARGKTVTKVRGTGSRQWSEVLVRPKGQDEMMKRSLKPYTY
jgi:hypothetical protein